MCLVYCVHDCRSVFHKFPDSIDVVISDQKQIFWAGTMEDLIFECHDRQVIKLQRDKEKIGCNSDTVSIVINISTLAVKSHP